jgi:hypothetical protein
MLNFLSRYILDLSSKNKPLTDMLKQESFALQEQHHECIMDVKHSTMSRLAFFYHRCRTIKLIVDGSKHGLGAEKSAERIP